MPGMLSNKLGSAPAGCRYRASPMLLARPCKVHNITRSSDGPCLASSTAEGLLPLCGGATVSRHGDFASRNHLNVLVRYPR
jgi:hypothetical protein